MSSTWTWQLADVSGAPDREAASTFPTQADAEAWLSESWRSLAERGVDNATLLRDGVTVYGPMSLRSLS